MAHTDRTTNYHFPKFVGNDKPSWLGDFNEAMDKMEAALNQQQAQINTLTAQVAALKVGN